MADLTVAVVGGRLQGTEICYLAKKAGIRSILIDKNPAPPASGLCDAFYRLDALDDTERLAEILKTADVVVPALEDDAALERLCGLCGRDGPRLAFDPRAYRISSSKRLSDAFFAENGVKCPAHYPKGGPPYIAKPSRGSGSKGVRLLRSAAEAEAFINETAEDYIIQEFIRGGQYSVEVIGAEGRYRAYEVTEVIVDETYDCKRVAAPADISGELKSRLADIAVSLARALGLTGIMDVEAILMDGEFYVLEIDARFPSQTPAAVYAATGVNLLSELYGLFTGRFPAAPARPGRFASYEHFLITGAGAAAQGEHIIRGDAPLRLFKGFMGADEALVPPGAAGEGAALTFINSADSAAELEVKRGRMIKRLKNHEWGRL